MRRKGIIFTLDMLIGLIMLVIIVISMRSNKFESTLPEKKYQRISMISNDITATLSNLKVDEARYSPTINNMINLGVIKTEDLNKTVLDIITSFWYAGNASIAGNISFELLDNITTTSGTCVAITVDDQPIYSSCNTSAKGDVSITSRIETGYEVGRPTYGYVARAFLTGIKSKLNSQYVYFGGYEGDGNLTKILQLPADANISSIYMEGIFGNNFTLYINNTLAGAYNTSYNVSSNSTFRSNSWIVCNATHNKNYWPPIKGKKQHRTTHDKNRLESEQASAQEVS